MLKTSSAMVLKVVSYFLQFCAPLGSYK
jgi:hypothetical protein